ncbi:hypothetical protein OAF21_08785 [Akkermansiaceae bacterium]|nr:hypothetical protein [bacterium]MDB4693685.1 hypothetical protein [Akkermansiaceae bacterium]MDB4708888.1 hypothetical protein [Akkermansiaceae bacterium]MDB4800581.1 hypothetical protein [bacterium]MDC1405478.1 hypothetical protein [Akkermansiaceae bacterium]
MGVGQSRTQDDLIADLVSSGEIIALEDVRDLIRVRDFAGASVDLIALSISIIEREAESGGFELFSSANWRGGEFSSVSSEGGEGKDEERSE